VLALEELDRRLAGRLDPILRQHPNLTATVIQGGDAGNVVPARCTLLLDRRTLPSEPEEEVVAELEAAIAAATRDRRAEVRLRPVRHVRGALTDPAEPIAQLLSSAVADISGGPPAPAGFFACCDMTYLAAAGMPTVIFGPGEAAMCHVFDESLALEDLRRAALVYLLTAHRWLAGVKG
jgi:acetylornithine deacetylase